MNTKLIIKIKKWHIYSVGHSILDFGHSILDIGHSILDFGHSILDFSLRPQNLTKNDKLVNFFPNLIEINLKLILKF